MKRPKREMAMRSWFTSTTVTPSSRLTVSAKSRGAPAITVGPGTRRGTKWNRGVARRSRSFSVRSGKEKKGLTILGKPRPPKRNDRHAARVGSTGSGPSCKTEERRKATGHGSVMLACVVCQSSRRQRRKSRQHVVGPRAGTDPCS